MRVRNLINKRPPTRPYILVLFYNLKTAAILVPELSALLPGTLQKDGPPLDMASLFPQVSSASSLCLKNLSHHFNAAPPCTYIASDSPSVVQLLSFQLQNSWHLLHKGSVLFKGTRHAIFSALFLFIWLLISTVPQTLKFTLPGSSNSHISSRFFFFTSCQKKLEHWAQCPSLSSETLPYTPTVLSSSLCYNSTDPTYIFFISGLLFISRTMLGPLFCHLKYFGMWIQLHYPETGTPLGSGQRSDDIYAVYSGSFLPYTYCTVLYLSTQYTKISFSRLITFYQQCIYTYVLYIVQKGKIND
jgi:hypothetical protein